METDGNIRACTVVSQGPNTATSVLSLISWRTVHPHDDFPRSGAFVSSCWSVWPQQYSVGRCAVCIFHFFSFVCWTQKHEICAWNNSLHFCILNFFFTKTWPLKINGEYIYCSSTYVIHWRTLLRSKSVVMALNDVTCQPSFFDHPHVSSKGD